VNTDVNRQILADRFFSNGRTVYAPIGAVSLRMPQRKQ